MESIEEIVEKIKEEFEEIGKPLQEGLDRIHELENNGLVLPDDLREFLTHANGISRVRGDKYFSFKLFPIEEYRSYNEFMDIPDDECENEQFEELYEGDNPKDFIVIGNEGEYGYFLINCNPDSTNYAKVYCVVVNIPENVAIWDTFYEFFKGLIEYVAENPIKKYKQTYITSEPTYIKKIDEEKKPEFVFNEEDYVNGASYNGITLPKEETRLLYEIEQLVGEEIPLLEDLSYAFLGYSVENSRVSKLKIYGRAMASIPDDIGDLSALTELNISECEIATLPNSLFTLKSLKRLTLYGNAIVYLPQIVEKLQNLEELNVGKNKMSFIPDQIGELTHLKKLQIGENRIESLPKTLGNLENLEEFSCVFNLLTEIPKEICDTCHHLIELAIYDNHIEKLPENIGNLQNLQKLIISSNNIKSFPGSIVNLRRLTYLNFYATHIIELNEEEERWIEFLKNQGCDVHPTSLEENRNLRI